MYLGKNVEADDKWEIERDFETLVRASEISGDKERLKKVQEFAKKQKENETDCRRVESNL